MRLHHSVFVDAGQNLAELELKNAWLSTHTLNPMPMLTNLTLELIRLNDKQLTELNKCLPNIQILNLIDISGLMYPIIHLFNLKSLHLAVNSLLSLTIITTNLCTLELKCFTTDRLLIEAPALSHLHLTLDNIVDSFSINKFENLKTLILESLNHDFLFPMFFPVTYSVENLTLESREWKSRAVRKSMLDLGKVSAIFSNVGSLRFKSCDLSELYPSLNLIGLKTLCIYLAVIDPSSTFSSIASVMDKCICLSEVSVVIKRDNAGDAYKSFISKCMAHWPLMNWKWGVWSDGREDSWLSI